MSRCELCDDEYPDREMLFHEALGFVCRWCVEWAENQGWFEDDAAPGTVEEQGT